MATLTYSSPASRLSSNENWLHPPCRPDNIDLLLSGVDRYNVQNLQVLEDYLLSDQVEGDAYDCMANLAILKLYQFNPDSVPPQELDTPYTPFLILLKALAHEPLGSDYSLYRAMLADQLGPSYSTAAVREGYHQIDALAKLLSARRFPQFWDKFNSDDLAPLQSTLDVLPTFVNTIRLSLALAAIQPTFRIIPRPLLINWFGMDSAATEELDALLSRLGWTPDADGAEVHIPENEENAPKGSIAREPLTFDKLSKILKQSQIMQ